MTLPDSTDDEHRTVEIPAGTAEKISNRLRGTEFHSVDEYVAFTLEQLLRELDRPESDDVRQDAESSGSGTESGVSGDEFTATDDAVEERLESLGYL